MKSIAELRKRARREMFVNYTITVYDFVDGVEVNRHHLSPLAPMVTAFNEMRDTIQDKLFAGFKDTAKAFKGLTDAINQP